MTDDYGTEVAVPESLPTPLPTVDERLDAIDAKLEQVVTAVNNIGAMMNSAMELFEQVGQLVQSPGGMMKMLTGGR